MLSATWEHFGTYDESEYPHLWNGRVGAWCPSVNPAGGTRLIDHSHYRNWGTLTNMDATSNWVLNSGRIALSFDGSNDFVDLGSRSTIMPTTAITLFAWAFRSSSQAAGDNGYVLSKPFVTAAPWYDFALRTSKTEFIGQVRLASANVQLSHAATTDDGWHLTCLTYDGSTVRFFVDGTERNSSAATGSIQYYTGTNFGGNKVLIGRWTETLVNQFQGLIDDLAIYDKAISVEQVRELYQLGRGGAYTPRSRMFYPIISSGRLLTLRRKAATCLA